MKKAVVLARLIRQTTTIIVECPDDMEDEDIAKETYDKMDLDLLNWENDSSYSPEEGTHDVQDCEENAESELTIDWED